MRTITTDYNNSAYNSETKFTCVYSANGLTVAAATPVDVRSMTDSVQAGDYVASATSMDIDASTSTPDVGGTDTVTITTKISSTATAGIPVRAISSDTAKVTVSPALARAKADGTVDFVLTAVGTDTQTATITFKTYGATDKTCAVTITEA
jgi:hypothetical protein